MIKARVVGYNDCKNIKLYNDDRYIGAIWVDELTIENEEKKGLILIHPSSHSLAIDIFGDEKIVRKYFLINDSVGYVLADCSYVKATGRSDYVCSEDLEHTEEINEEVVKGLIGLIKEGFEVQFMEEKPNEGA